MFKTTKGKYIMKTLISTVLLSLVASVSYAQESNWSYFENVDPFTDKNDSRLILATLDQTSGHDPYGLVLRCDIDHPRGVEVFMVSEGFIDSDSSIRVTYRFGSQDPESKSWNSSTNGTSAFLPIGYKDFIANLKTGEDFVFGFYDYNGTLGYSKFDNDANHPKLNYFLNGCK